MRTALKMLVAGVSAALCASATFAQGCALCYSDAAATGPTAQAALRHGILILVIPATSIVVGFFSLLCIRRNMHRESVVLVPATFSSPFHSVSEGVLHLN